jgi:hypothetical protein
MSPAARSGHLVTALQAAVMLRMLTDPDGGRIDDTAGVREQVMSAVAVIGPPTTSRAATVLGQYGDILQHGGHRPGETGEVFNVLVAGIAALAHVDGGVDAFGLHWCAARRHYGIPSGRVPVGCPDAPPNPLVRPTPP